MIMVAYISMLRGINVSGQKKVKMTELKELYESLGYKNVKTYIQSGNVVFELSPNKVITLSNLKNKIENKINQKFGFNVSVIIRTKDDFAKLIKNKPSKIKDEARLYVTFLSDQPKESLLEGINKFKDSGEEIFLFGKEIYLFFPNGYGRTKLSNNLFERKLKLIATTRNWNTINALFSMANE